MAHNTNSTRENTKYWETKRAWLLATIIYAVDVAKKAWQGMIRLAEKNFTEELSEKEQSEYLQYYNKLKDFLRRRYEEVSPLPKQEHKAKKQNIVRLFSELILFNPLILKAVVTIAKLIFQLLFKIRPKLTLQQRKLMAKQIAEQPVFDAINQTETVEGYVEFLQNIRDELWVKQQSGQLYDKIIGGEKNSEILDHIDKHRVYISYIVLNQRKISLDFKNKLLQRAYDNYVRNIPYSGLSFTQWQQTENGKEVNKQIDDFIKAKITQENNPEVTGFLSRFTQSQIEPSAPTYRNSKHTMN